MFYVGMFFHLAGQGSLRPLRTVCETFTALIYLILKERTDPLEGCINSLPLYLRKGQVSTDRICKELEKAKAKAKTHYPKNYSNEFR